MHAVGVVALNETNPEMKNHQSITWFLKKCLFLHLCYKNMLFLLGSKYDIVSNE